MNFFEIALLLLLLLKTHTAFCQQDKKLFSENILCNTEHGSCQKISAEKFCSKLLGHDKTVFCENRKKKLHMAIKQAQQYVDEHFNISRSSFSNREKQKNTLWAVYTASHITAKQLSYPALVTVHAAKYLKSAGMTINEIEKEFSRFELDQAGLDKICPSKPIEECAPGGFRTYSGFCNNVKKPLWGSAFQAFDRMDRASYNDDISEPRKSLNNSTLPACDEISRILFNSYEKKKSKLSLMVAQWANMIYNDMARIGSNKNEHLEQLDCCGADRNNTECLPIENFYISGKKTCIPYARTMPAPAESCSLGSRKQSNQVNSFLDASPIYGSMGKRAEFLRTKLNGKLKMAHLPNNQEAMLQSPKDFKACTESTSKPCFLSGSDTANLFPTLSALHTVWVKQHNQLTLKLKKVNQFWDDERLYQEAKKIVGAQIQHITFNEFLPLVIDYNINFNPNTLNEYAAAAGFFFYGLLPEKIVTKYSETKATPIRDAFYNPSLLYEQHGILNLIKFLITESSLIPIGQINNEFRQHFLKTNNHAGFDMMAILIQMGRDHGLPPYVVVRQQCSLKKIETFDDLHDVLQTPSDAEKIKKIYFHVNDIDLVIMGFLEKPADGAVVGPTFACILARQFAKMQRGDRFWYENYFYPSSFTGEQLSEIRKTSLARILCDNVKNLKEIQPFPFMIPDIYENSVLKCSSNIIEKIDLTPWTDSKFSIKLPMTKEKIKTAIHIAEGRIRQIRSREKKNNQPDIKNDLHDFLPFPHGHHMKPNQIAIDQAKIADVLLEATRILIIQDEFNVHKPIIPELDIDYLQNILPNIDVRDFIGKAKNNNEICNKKPFPCDPTATYRTTTGWCNNIKSPTQGMAFSTFRRLLKPAYNDGNNSFDEPRKFGVNGDPLPSARHVANVIHKSKDIIHKKYSHILMTFGQFLDHDLTHTPMSLALDGSLLNCQRCDSHETVSVNCWPIKIPKNDPYFPSTFDDGSPRCMHFARSLIGQLKLGYREQMNQLTSYIDASNVYGSNDCIASDLRLFSQGKLNISKHLPGIQNTLPFGFKDPDCRVHSTDCFIAGDIRVNENSGLMVPHILFVREHNRLAEKLFMANNLWSDEKIYQEIRKIIGAVMQHIVFKEWLPKVLGHQLMEKYELYLMKSGYFKGYDKYCDATISNEFASAAFRFGHTLIRDTFLFMDPKHNTLMEQIRLKDMFFNITPLNDFNRGGIQSMISGLIRTPAMAFDRFINQDLRNHLFEFKHEPFSGMDLPAINIQRARDHGIPGYNSYREVCGFKKAKNFQDLLDVIDQETIDDLKNLYKHVDDIDLFPGLISEKPISGALVGPTLGCLIGEQMQRLRKCDRFWYENDITETKFTPGQLSEIRKMTMAKIICNNSKNIKKIQPNVFDLPDNHMNKEVDCSVLPDIDITKWLDRDFCFVGNKIIQMGRTKHITPCVSCTCTHYGANCHALRVESCNSLFDQFSMAEIAADTSCVIQCSGMINSKKNQTQ
ncbi:Peroxidasin -like protein [Trichinella zimbabwensis]|uniref:Peroxidasin-like protein n=1 Tax=Trichinella zimbabwensis TaxID=268475 RepID=A0A0V1I8Q1_9BILA|nr:Peroxidasin -like protein [Trichinella zimbabwensis]